MPHLPLSLSSICLNVGPYIKSIIAFTCLPGLSYFGSWSGSQIEPPSRHNLAFNSCLFISLSLCSRLRKLKAAFHMLRRNHILPYSLWNPSLQRTVHFVLTLVWNSPIKHMCLTFSLTHTSGKCNPEKTGYFIPNMAVLHLAHRITPTRFLLRQRTEMVLPHPTPRFLAY